jgi:hypothetical protein
MESVMSHKFYLISGIRIPIIEPSRVRQVGNLWVVEILSDATGQWIVQGEHLTQAAAEQDRRENW